MSGGFGAKARQRSLARRGRKREEEKEGDVVREREMMRKELVRELVRKEEVPRELAREKEVVEAEAPPSSREAAMAVFVGLCWAAYKREFPASTVSKRFVAARCALRWEAMEEGKRAAFHRMAEGGEQEAEAGPAARSLQAPTFRVVAAPSKVQHKLTRVGGEGKKRKKVKDPNKPRAPTSSYLLYCREERARVREEVPALAGAAAPAMAKELGRRSAIVWARRNSTFKSPASQCRMT